MCDAMTKPKPNPYPPVVTGSRTLYVVVHQSRTHWHVHEEAGNLRYQTGGLHAGWQALQDAWKADPIAQVRSIDGVILWDKAANRE